MTIDGKHHGNVSFAIWMARQAASICLQPACKDARAQADRVPGLLDALARLGGLMRQQRRWSLEASARMGRAETYAMEKDHVHLKHVTELRGIIASLREQGRDLQDALTHAHHQRAEAEGQAFAARIREKELQAQVEREQRFHAGTRLEFMRAQQLAAVLKHDLLLLLEEKAAAVKPEPAKVVELTPRIPWRHFGDRRQAEVRGSLKRALGHLNARDAGTATAVAAGASRFASRRAGTPVPPKDPQGAA